VIEGQVRERAAARRLRTGEVGRRAGGPGRAEQPNLFTTSVGQLRLAPVIVTIESGDAARRRRVPAALAPRSRRATSWCDRRPAENGQSVDTLDRRCSDASASARRSRSGDGQVAPVTLAVTIDAGFAAGAEHVARDRRRAAGYGRTIVELADAVVPADRDLESPGRPRSAPPGAVVYTRASNGRTRQMVLPLAGRPARPPRGGHVVVDVGSMSGVSIVQAKEATRSRSRA
jgi:hypothetical protein